MTVEQVRKGMLDELDWEASEFGKYTDKEVKNQVASEYSAKASAYNMLIRNLFGDEKLIGHRFPRKIEKYIELRKDGKWVTW